jgi:hypothetical protein
MEDDVGGEFDLADAVAIGRVDGVALPVCLGANRLVQ